MNFLAFDGTIVMATVFALSSASQCTNDYTFEEKIGCYKIYNSYNFSVVKTWEQAQNVCQENQANLAVIKSDDEALYFVDVMDETAVYWAWVGVREKNGEWTTVTGQSLNLTGYDNWLYKDDDHTPEVDKCLVLVSGYPEPGLLQVPCDLELHMFICRV